MPDDFFLTTEEQIVIWEALEHALGDVYFTGEKAEIAGNLAEAFEP